MQKKLLPYEITGNQQSKVMLIFLHGWPDTLRLWDDVIKTQEKDFLCLNISYNVDDTYGIYFKEIVVRLKNTIDYEEKNRNLKKVFISFDWGAIFAYQFDKAFPKFISDHIACDVAPNVNTNGKPQLKQILCFAFYQIFLAMAFLISFLPICGIFVANLLTYIMAILVGSNQSYSTINARKMNYPYFYLWFGGIPPPILQSISKKSHMYNYKPSSKIVFLYGKNKKLFWAVNFHGSDWIQIINSIENSEVHGLQGGHWVMRDNFKFFVAKIQERIQVLIK